MLAAAFGVVLITVGTQAAFAKVPQFKDYAVREVHSGQVAQPDLNSHSDAATFRTRLRNAAKGVVNFAGKYVLVQWGCGTTCVHGALLDAENGKVIFLPFSVCCWTDVDDGFKPIEFRPNSRLIVFSGLRDEKEPMGAHFYEFRDVEFVFVETVGTASDFRGAGNKERGAGILGIRPAKAGSTPLGNLPIPVRAYILREALEIGIEDPLGVELNEGVELNIAGTAGNDINMDGLEDYAVSLCFFIHKNMEFWTNGFPCAFGNLIVSKRHLAPLSYGAYQFIPITGLIRASKPAKFPYIIMTERGFGRCKGYYCDVLYQLKESQDPQSYRKLNLEEIKICEDQECELPED